MASVLLVEDVEIVRMVLRKFIESAGHRVVECEGGDDASRQVGAGHFDLVVTDLWMKNGDGVSFIASELANDRPLPIIAMTGGNPNASGSQSIEAARRAGATRVLMKPVTKTDILEAIEFALGQMQAA